MWRVADDDPNHKFLTTASNCGVDVALATKNPRIDALVAQGTTIRGVLETALQSDLPGMVRGVALVHGCADAVLWAYRLGRAMTFGVFDASDLSAFRKNPGAIFQCRPSNPTTLTDLRL